VDNSIKALHAVYGLSVVKLSRSSSISNCKLHLSVLLWNFLDEFFERIGIGDGAISRRFKMGYSINDLAHSRLPEG